jgi:excisionase family DNA binding protein
MATGLRKMTYCVEEAATVLGVSTSKISDSVRNGELRAVQLGRRVVIPSDVLTAWPARDKRRFSFGCPSRRSPSRTSIAPQG